MYINLEIGQQLSWIFGIISNGLWLVVFIPQIYQNYKNKNSEAISLSLLFCLILGDIFSIVSANSKDLNLVIIYSAAYHILLDLIVVFQILYYRRLKDINHLEENTPLLLDTSDIQYTYFYLTTFEFIFISIFGLVVLVLQLLLLFLPDKPTVIYIADIIGWSATCIFMIARIPQIVLNFKRKSTKGLSLMSFIIINIANFFFLMSILILLYDLPQSDYITHILKNIQWIVGSSSTTLFDAVIFYQFIRYKNNTDFDEI